MIRVGKVDDEKEKCDLGREGGGMIRVWGFDFVRD